jgi:uncharacterized protein (TIGR00369 family)
MTDVVLPEQLESLLRESAYHQFLDIRLEQVTEEFIVVRLPQNNIFVSGQEPGYIHGGIIATLIDIAGYFSVFRKLNIPTPTIDLRVDYLRPARSGDLLARASVIKLGRMVSVAEISVTDEDGKQVAIGRGLFSSKQA